MSNLKGRAREIIASAESNVEGLIQLFEDDELPGETALQRLKWILRITASDWPGMQMGLFSPDDSGFRTELADGRYYRDPAAWADLVRPEQRRTKQVGHFLTAAGLCCNRWPTSLKLRLIVGHELLGDHLPFNFVRQFFRASTEHTRLFLQAVEDDRAGNESRRDAGLRAIFGTGAEAVRDPHRIGNSLADLRLSVKGWRFGEEIKCRAVKTRREAADWLRREIFDPARRRQPLARQGKSV